MSASLCRQTACDTGKVLQENHAQLTWYKISVHPGQHWVRSTAGWKGLTHTFLHKEFHAPNPQLEAQSYMEGNCSGEVWSRAPGGGQGFLGFIPALTDSLTALDESLANSMPQFPCP